MNKYFFLLLFCFNLGLLQAQDYDDEVYTEVITEDSLFTQHYKNMYEADSVLQANPVTENTLHPKKFRENVSSRYTGPDYDYTTTKPRESFFAKLQRKIAELLRSIFGETSFEKSAGIANVLIRLFAILLVGLILYFIVKYFIGKEGSFFFGKKNKKLDIKSEDLHENIHEINFPQSIAQFENSRDYRSAVRYQFLYALKRLSDRKHISWNPEKTNKDYVAELKVTSLRDDFSGLSYIFDYVWYGEFSINEESYVQFRKQFQDFKP